MTPRFIIVLLLKESGEISAAALTGTSKTRKVSQRPAANLESGCPHSDAEQQASSAGKKRNATAMRSIAKPAMSTYGRNAGIRNASTRPLKSGVCFARKVHG